MIQSKGMGRLRTGYQMATTKNDGATHNASPWSMNFILGGKIGLSSSLSGAVTLKAHRNVANSMNRTWLAMSFPGQILRICPVSTICEAGAFILEGRPSARAKCHVALMMSVWYGIGEIAASVKIPFWSELVVIREPVRVTIHRPD